MYLGLLQRYVLKSIFPYFLSSLCFLTVTLTVQQVSKTSEALPDSLGVFTSTVIITKVLIPKILMFTIPMSTLIGVVLGLNKLKSESELRVIQCAGINPLIVALPLVLVSCLVAVVCGYNNLFLAPGAQRWFKDYVNSEATAQQVSSSIDIGTFNSNIPNLTLYIRQGNSLKGEWSNIFLVKKEAESERVITASTGRLDVEGQKVELVLNDVHSLSYPLQIKGESAALVVERFSTFRLELERQTVQASDSESKDKIDFNELGTDELVSLSQKGSAQSREADMQLHRRAALALSPVVFAAIGFIVVWFSSESSRVWALILALTLLVTYYLVFLLSEQFSRSGFLYAFMGGWIANASMLLFVPTVFYLKRPVMSFLGGGWGLGALPGIPCWRLLARRRTVAIVRERQANWGRYKAVSFPMLLDLSVLRRLSLFFLISYMVFVSLFFVFTVFELWKSIFANQVALSVVGRYLLHLLPYVSTQVFAPSAMIAALTVFLIMVNRSEIPVWLGTGVSVYRILLPIVCFALCTSAVTWAIQDYLMPKSNLVQDALRFQIRTGYPKSIAYSGRQWIALGDKIFNYEFNAGNGSLTNPFLYQLDRQGQVQRLFLASKGMWMNGQLQFIGGSLVETQPSAKLVNFQQVPIDSVVGPGYFSTGLNKPFYLSVRQLKDQINIMDARGENTASLKLSLQKKYADPLVPFVLAILGACVGLLFARGKPLRQILVAVLFGVSVIAVTQLFASLGLSYGLPAMVVAWSPTLIFGSVAFYLLASLRT